MKLIDKFTLWFLAITAVVLFLGGLIVFYSVQYEIDQEAIRRIRSSVRHVARELRQGRPIAELVSDQIHVKELNLNAPAVKLTVYDTMGVFGPRRRAIDRKLTISESYQIDGKHYLISASDFVAEPDEIADGVIESLTWTFVMLLVIVFITSRLVSKRILSPFHKTLESIREFSLRRQQEISPSATHTYEFKRLNSFLQKMTLKARDDYRALKEFTENASHELQTPLAVIKGKLELLLESAINDEQARQILGALNAAEKLSKINQSLALLNKLENREFDAPISINYSHHVLTVMDELKELMDMKSISINTDIHPNVKVSIHPSLADILLMNLFSNAIRHNHENGTINVKLTWFSFVIQNTGPEPAIPTEQLFQRFKKNNQSSDSIGLGLAIVKQICEVSGLSVSYDYKNSLHNIEVRWPLS